MSRRKLKSLILLSISNIASVTSNPSFSSHLLRVSTPSPSWSRQNILSHVAKFICTSSPDNLDGLVDPDDPILRDAWRMESVSAEEFASITDSLLGSDADSRRSEPKAEGGEFSNDAILISDAIRNDGDVFGNQTQKFLRQFREKLNESLVVEVLNLLQKPELGVKFFIWAGRQVGYSHTGAVYNALLEMMGCNDSDRVPESFLQEINRDDREVLRILLNFLIRKCCRSGLWNLALEELGRLKDFGYKPTRLTYNALVQVFLKADRLDSAYLVHREMSSAGFKMDGFTLGCFVHSLCKVGRCKEALMLIEKEEFVPDTVLYTKMISGLCEASRFEEAMDILSRMRCDSCHPNVITYRILLCGCLNKKKLGRCKRVLSMMMAEGCYPSPKIFNSLVHAYCVSGDYAYAYKLLKRMVACGCHPSYVVYNILIGGICGIESPSSDVLELAEKAYSEMLDARVVLNKVNVINFARCLCRAGKFEKAHSIIKEMMTKGFVPDASTYSKVIGFLCNASKIESAFSLFAEMKSTGTTPDVYTYTILIDSFCKAGLIEQAQNWFNEMVRDGCAPNVVTYTALIHAYLKVRKLTNASELFGMMLSDGCVPNIVTYSALIDGHCKAGEIEKACKIYERMRGNVESPGVDNYFSVDNGNAKKPNVFTYGALVDGLCKAHKVREAHDLLDAMIAENCEPNHIVYDALIDGFCKVGKLDDAQEVLSKMTDRGYDPSVFTYGSFIDRMFKDKRLDLALKVLSQMLENSCAPNVVVYTEMVDGLCKVGKTDEAYKLMVMMREKGCFPNVVTYTAMIDGFGKAGKVDKCLELFKQMAEKGCAPNYITYSVLINHCCAAGLLDEARQLLDEMKLTYWPMDVMSYNKVIEGFNREFVMSHGLLGKMSENDSAPISSVYRLLIDYFIKAGRLEVALELHEEISSLPKYSATNTSIYASLIESLILAGKVDKALELYADIIRKVGVQELSTFVHLIKGLTQVNKWEEALQLSDSLCQMNVLWLSEEEASNRK